MCGRPLCLSCATPVRGGLVGPECLATVLDEAPPPSLRERPLHPGIGGRLAILGFALVVLLTLFPWSHGRSSGSSGYLAAWTLHWSLIAALARWGFGWAGRDAYPQGALFRFRALSVARD